MRYWTGTGIGIHEETQLLESKQENKEEGDRAPRPSHLNVVLSKVALSGPSVCLRARAPCPLCVSCPGADRSESAQLSCELSRSVPCSGSRQAAGSGVPLLVLGKTGLFARRSAHARNNCGPQRAFSAQ